MSDTSYSRLLLYGFVTYAAIFMLWSFLAAYGLAYGVGAQVASYVATIIVVGAAARMAGIVSFKNAFVYGIAWALMHMLLDAVYVVPAAGVAPFSTPFAWIGYAIVLGTPSLVALYSRFQTQ